MLVARHQPPTPPQLEPVSAPTILSRSSISTISTLQSAASDPSSDSSATTPGNTTAITKDWTLPPRPKPGRKPAADIPPTRSQPPTPPQLEPISANATLSRSSISTVANLQNATSDPTSASAATTPDNTNSITKEWTLQPRPKPGRKPATDVPPTKRKQQNREAQRAFRERRQARVEDLEEELQQERQRHSQEEARWAHERNYHNQREAHWHELEQQLASNHWQMRQTAEAWRQRALYVETQCAQYHSDHERMREQVAQLDATARHDGGMTGQVIEPQQPVMVEQVVPGLPTANEASCQTCDPVAGNCACLEAMTQPQDTANADEDVMEIDFTNMRPSSIHSHAAISIEQETTAAIVTDGCGFCHAPGGTECPCETLARPDVETHNAMVPQPAIMPASTAPAFNSTSTPMYGPITNASPTLAPGSCEACQLDPDRRRFCQTLASSVPMAMPPPALPSLSTGTSTTANSPASTSLAHGAPRTQPSTAAGATTTASNTVDSSRISCSEAYTRFQQSQSRDHTGYVRNLRAQLHDCGEDEATSTSTAAAGGHCGHGGHVHNGRSCAPLEVEVASVLVAMGEMDRERRESMRHMDGRVEENPPQAEGNEDRKRKRRESWTSDERELQEGELNHSE